MTTAAQGARVTDCHLTWRDGATTPQLAFSVPVAAQLPGLSDVAVLIAIFGVDASMILVGWLQERYETPGRGGWLTKVGRWADHLFGERVHVLLSLVAKSALAWQVFGGTLAG